MDGGEIVFRQLPSYNRKPKNNYKLNPATILRYWLLVPDFPARARAKEKPIPMWTTLFTLTLVISVALSFAAIVMDNIRGGSG
ncbi:MAG: hypothetical protein ACM3IH_19470 [Sphingobacteriales bacterium]